MEIIHCSKLINFSNTTRKYYNAGDIRISDVSLHNTEEVHRYHKHNLITEILFILEGSIKVKIIENGKIKESIVNKNNIAIFKPGELHTVASINETARVMVFKYLSEDKNLIETFINDFQDE
jgi:mannose-6-phosphate isomerase-like protein (cupin superfamily)